MTEEADNADKAIQFYTALDNILLRELVASRVNLDKAPSAVWTKVHKHICTALKRNERITIRQVKDRAKSLHKKHLRDELKSLKSSGTTEEYDERVALLTEYTEILEELKAEEQAGTSKGKKSQSQKEVQGVYMRNKAMEALKNKGMPKLNRVDIEQEDEEEENEENGDDIEVQAPKKKKPKHEALLDYLREKHEEERKLKKEELELNRSRMEKDAQERKAMLDFMMVMAQNLNGAKK